MENDLEEITHGFIVDEHYVMNNDDGLDQEENNSDGGSKAAPLREQDRFLPIANIAKIMKKAIPDKGKIAKDARECVQECISEFISFVTSEASDRCQVEKRKTINGEDVLYALNTLGFDNYIEPLKIYLTKYREMVLSPALNKVKVVFEDVQEGTDSNQEPADNNETDQKSETVLYTYPKVIDFTI